MERVDVKTTVVYTARFTEKEMSLLVSALRTKLYRLELDNAIQELIRDNRNLLDAVNQFLVDSRVS